MTAQNIWKRQVHSKAILDPTDRISEVLFGLIMVLSFTGAIRASNGSEQEIKELLWAALGCNLAWGLVDAMMHLMNVVISRGHGLQLVKKLRSITEDEELIQWLRGEVQPVMSEILSDDELLKLANKVKQFPEPTPGLLFSWADLKTALQIFFLVFLCTLPVALPFALMDEVTSAMQVSNGMALLMLFMGGFQLGRYSGFKPALAGMAYALAGIALVAITMALGG